jgi:hypothetical protein
VGEGDLELGVMGKHSRYKAVHSLVYTTFTSGISKTHKVDIFCDPCFSYDGFVDCKTGLVNTS